MSNYNAAAKSHFWAVIAVLVFAVALGGGGSKYGTANMLVQLCALIALGFHRRAFVDFWKSAPLALKSLVVLTILLPAAFIVPLPQGVWSALPGRELMAQSLDLVDANDWATASVEPIRTLLALTALIVPLAILTIGWIAPKDRLVTIGWIAVGLGLVNFLIGIPQVLSNSEVGVLYPENPMPGVLFGTFANRNSTGLFLVGTLTLAALLPAIPRFGRQATPIRIAACALLIVAIVLTRSRTAFVLALIPLAALGVQMFFSRSRPGSVSKSRAVLLFGPAILAIGVIATLAIGAPGRVGDVVERFEGEGEDARAFIWEDALYSADRYWPVGAGTGTFDDVFQIDESLENLTVRTAGRAHNDYLELAIEAGIPGLVLAAAWLLLVLWLCWRARHSRHRWIAWSGGIVLLTIALQSITDYPLRNLSLMAFGSFALVLLARFGEPSRENRT